MGEVTGIAWTDHTFNAWIGCFKVSDGCKNCYAAVDTFARRSRSNGLELWGKNAERHVTSETYWKQPLKWDRQAREAGVQRRVFCSSLSDFAEVHPDSTINAKLNAARERLFALIEQCPNLTWLLLTKRPENLPNVLPAHWLKSAPKNVWLGTTTENQEQADRRITALVQVPAEEYFVSAEPLLEELTLRKYLAFSPQLACTCARDNHPANHRCNQRWTRCNAGLRRITWVIVGGESGKRARPFWIEWARKLRRQCASAEAAFFMKQAGASVHTLDDFGAQLLQLRDKKGGDLDELPEDLRVRQFPRAA
jgi:protein gp37